MDALKVFNINWPEDYFKTASSLGDLLFNNGYWKESIDAYQKAMKATEKLYDKSLLRMEKELVLISSSLYQRAAYAAVKINCPHEAVIFIERGVHAG